MAIGLPALRVFFSTRPIQADNREASPEVLLHEVLQSPNLNIDEMAVDMIRLSPASGRWRAWSACRQKYLAGVLAALEAAGSSRARPSRRPAPCCATRRAAPAAAAAKAFVRVFLGAAGAWPCCVARPTCR